MKAIRKIRNLYVLFLCFAIVVGMLAFPTDKAIVKAEEGINVETTETTEETETTEITEETETTEVPKEPVADPDEVYRNIKKLVDEELFEDIEWVEAVVEKNSKQFGKPIWFSKAYKKWNIPITKWKDGHYIVKLYYVEGYKEEYWDKDDLITSVDIELGKMTYKSFEAKSSTNKTSKRPAITYELKGLTDPCGVKSVEFSFSNEKGKVVYKKKMKPSSNGNYTAQIPASKLAGKPGKYKISATVTEKCGKKKVIAKKPTVTLKFANVSVKAVSADKATGTFMFKTNAIYAASAIKSVQMRVWCKNSDKKTYSNLKRQSDGTYSVKVDASKHGYHFGIYHAEVVVTLKNGSKGVVASNTYKFAPGNLMRYYKETSKNRMTVWMYNPTEKSKLYADVWSQKSKGSDKFTYEVPNNGKYLKLTVNMKKLTHSGDVYVLFKKKSGNSYKTVKKISFYASDSDISKNGWYYEKASNGKTYRYYYSKGEKVKDLTKVLGLKSGANNKKLYVEVNSKCNTVTVYDQDPNGNWNTPVIAFTCSVGNSWTPTPTGTYKTDRNHRWKMLMGPSWGQYSTHIVNGIYFHSVAGRNTTPYNISAYSYNKLGSAASHGCIRLCVRDAKWIYDHCAIGSTVHIYDSDFSGPLGKPKTIKIPSSQNWDPTDPAVKKK